MEPQIQNGDPSVGNGRIRRKDCRMAPSRPELDGLHSAVLAGDPTAPPRVFELLLQPLIERLRFDGGGIWSFVHVDDAAVATVVALERGTPGTTTLSTTNPRPSASGYLRSQKRSAPSRPAASRAGLLESWRARPA